MINRWEASEEVKAKATIMIHQFIQHVEEFDESPQLDLSDSGLNPYTLEKLLNGMGYETGDTETNGWQWDFWTDMKKEGFKSLQISGTGATFELNLSELEEY